MSQELYEQSRQWPTTLRYRPIEAAQMTKTAARFKFERCCYAWPSRTLCEVLMNAVLRTFCQSLTEVQHRPCDSGLSIAKPIVETCFKHVQETPKSIE